MRVFYQKKDGTQEEIDARSVTLQRSYTSDDYGTGTTNTLPLMKERMYLEATTEGISDDRLENRNPIYYTSIISMNTTNDSCVQISIPYLISSDSSYNQPSMYIRSTNDLVQAGITKHWSDWRRIAFYDEIASVAESTVQKQCPFPVGFTMMVSLSWTGINTMISTMKSAYPGTTWSSSDTRTIGTPDVIGYCVTRTA